jgi:mRNA turnover protein 4
MKTRSDNFSLKASNKQMLTSSSEETQLTSIDCNLKCSVSLTKTRGKGRPQKTKLVEDLRAAVDEYQHIYVFSFENMRASIFKDIRLHFRESRYPLMPISAFRSRVHLSNSLKVVDALLYRIFMGKNKIAQVALGRSPEEEFKDNLRHVSTVSIQLQ